jgi:hypothetical protein
VKEPLQLPSSIWVPLRRYKLVRTPQEQQYHLLHNAPVAVVLETPYSAGLKRALSAALALNSKTRDLRFVFKGGDTGNLNLLIDGSDLLIHEDWLDFKASHQAAPCWLSTLASTQEVNIETFSCDHIINDLYNLVLNEFKSDVGMACSLRLKVSESLREMPRKVEIAQGPDTGEIEVSWVDAAGEIASKLHGLNVKCRITLHRESTCSQKKSELLASAGA